MNYVNHYKLGNSSATHRGKIIKTSLNSPFENFLQTMPAYSYEIGYVPAGYEHRPDLISNLFYDTPTNDWLIMMYNNISDPFQGLNVGDRVLIPKL